MSKLSNTPIVISFYTVDTPYEEEVKKLKTSCEKWSLENCIEGVESVGTWEGNCARKPFFILEKLIQLKRPVLWVDADGIFLQPPDFNQFDTYDFSVRINEMLHDNHDSKVISNTIFVNYTEKGVDILKKWCEECITQLKNKDRIKEFWDQTALRDIILSDKSAKILPMPLGYSKIFDLDFLFISYNQVVIEHYQASRRFRTIINEEKI